MKTIFFENKALRLGIGEDASLVTFADLRDGFNYAEGPVAGSFAAAKIKNETYPASRAVKEGENLVRFSFHPFPAEILLRVSRAERYFIIKVEDVEGSPFDELVFVNAALSLERSFSKPFAASILALNLRTNSRNLPGLNSVLDASCCREFGFRGAEAAVIGCPTDELRTVMQEAVEAAPELPVSKLGGPWALDPAINRESYLFDLGDVNESNVGEWIELMRALGFKQLNFHGGHSFRFGDLEPFPEYFPNGFDSLKAVIDRLHDAGMSAGLHTYAFFIDKNCPWVTPKPHPELGRDAEFTLAEPIDSEADTVPVKETTEMMSAVTGFSVRNSATLQIGDELITYTGASKESPFGFTGCLRGEHGTRKTGHPAGSPVYHLKECFGLFTPEAGSSLLDEVAAKTADVYNYCGFDMIYLDALDGEDILAGHEKGWHYGSKFVFEINRHLNKPAVMEMSTFHHHLWYVRSRMGAWDYPRRAHKQFIDKHVEANQNNSRLFLPGVMGWWSLLFWSGPDSEPTYSDDIEYLCAKSLATDNSLALLGVDPAAYAREPGIRRLCEIIRRYEDLRLSGQVPEKIKSELRRPGKDFTLTEDSSGRQVFVPVSYARHRVASPAGDDRKWKVENPYSSQPLRVRIESLLSAGTCEGAEPVFSGFGGMETAASTGTVIRCDEVPSSPGGESDALAFRARTGSRQTEETWARLEKTFDPPLNLMGAKTRVAVQGQAKMESLRRTVGLGLWVQGDGNGQTLSVQLRSPKSVSSAVAGYYIDITFSGWRYFELIEPEAERCMDFPRLENSKKTKTSGGADAGYVACGDYGIYRSSVDFTRIESVSFWYYRLPADRDICCLVKPPSIIPLLNSALKDPKISVGKQSIVFPVSLESGQYMEFNGSGPALVFNGDGGQEGSILPEDPVPLLEQGVNEMAFSCGGSTIGNVRSRITVISSGDTLET